MDRTNELYVLDRNLNIIQSLKINNIEPVKDIISPQKTIIEIPLNEIVHIGDFVYIKENGEQKYLGVIQDLLNDKTTILSTYPLINVTNTECVLNNINGNVADWIINTLTENFVTVFSDDTDRDNYFKLIMSFVVDNVTESLSMEIKDNNLFDVLLDIFLKTGVYIEFDLDIEDGLASSIICTIKKASDNYIEIKYDNPLILKKPKIEFTQAQLVNKVIFVPESENINQYMYAYYLLQDNTITRNPNANGRIRGVVQTIQKYNDEDYTAEQPDGYEPLQLKAEELLIGNSYSHEITIIIKNNNAYNFELYNKVRYIDKNSTYTTYVTGIEEHNGYHKTIRLGVLRTRLTDTIKGLSKGVSKSITSIKQNNSVISFEKENGSTIDIKVAESKISTTSSVPSVLKFDNGIMIQWFSSLGLTGSGDATITWAYPFIDTDYAVNIYQTVKDALGDNGWLNSTAIQQNGKSTTSCIFYKAFSEAGYFNIIAIGKWK